MEPSPYLDLQLVAGCDRLALPVHFAAPARDLVTLAAVAPGSWVLDLGCGTGAVSAPAAAATGAAGIVVALDPSLPMLRVLQAKAIACLPVAGGSPGLPFRSRCFDVVLGNFVLSHFADPEAALADVRRTLRPGGRAAFTSWAPVVSPLVALWEEIAHRHADLAELQAEARRAIPWGERFAHAVEVARVLETAGFGSVVVERRTYPVRLPTADYLVMRETSVEGTLLRRHLEAPAWERCRAAMASAFHDRFGDSLAYERDVHLACGVAGQV